MYNNFHQEKLEFPEDEEEKKALEIETSQFRQGYDVITDYKKERKILEIDEQWKPELHEMSEYYCYWCNPEDKIQMIKLGKFEVISEDRIIQTIVCKCWKCGAIKEFEEVIGPGCFK